MIYKFTPATASSLPIRSSEGKDEVHKWIENGSIALIEHESGEMEKIKAEFIIFED